MTMRRPNDFALPWDYRKASPSEKRCETIVVESVALGDGLSSAMYKSQ